MEAPKDVLISGDRHIIIHGQFGNLTAKLNQLRQMLDNGGYTHYLPYVVEIGEELDYLKKVYPSLDGEVKYVDPRSGSDPTEGLPSKLKQASRDAIVRARLQDMRALVDAAYTSHTHEGTIDCRLKLMFDAAWENAADAAGIERIDDIPF